MKKIMMTILSVLFCAGVIFTGCQKTPERQAVINKQQDVPQDALVSRESSPEEEKKDFYEPVDYHVSEHWKEDIIKDENFLINADVDVMMPEITVYPVQKLGQMELTQERVDEMIARFIEPGAQFYALPVPLTKEYYEEEILRLKESLAQVEAGGDGETPDSIRSRIEEVEKDYAKAPQDAQLEPADTKFTYRRDYDTGKPVTEYGENEIFIGTKGSDGVNRMISAMRPGRADNRGNSFFSYNDTAASQFESTLLLQEHSLAMEQASADFIQEEPYRSQRMNEVAQAKEAIEATKEKYAQNQIDLDAMQNKAIELLKELDITGVQIISCEKALFAPDTAPSMSGWSRDNIEATQPGCLISFSRENGGIPCVAQMNGGSAGMLMEGMYSAPFFPERGTVLFDQDGNVRSFLWSDLSAPQELVSEDSKILAFDEAKDRIVDHLYWKCFPQAKTGELPEGMDQMPRMKYRYEIEEVKLVMTYINVRNEPDMMLAVPAWQVKAQGFVTYLDDTIFGDAETIHNEEEVQINAIDGSPILMPGMMQIEAEQ